MESPSSRTTLSGNNQTHRRSEANWQKRWKALLLLSALLLGSACSNAEQWNESHKANFLRACRREAGYEKQDLCTPLATEIDIKIKEGGSKTCLLFAANEIAVAAEPEQREQAREKFDNC